MCDTINSGIIKETKFSTEKEVARHEKVSGLALKEEEALFKRYQPIVTAIVYKFSFLGGHKRAEDAWKHYLGLEAMGLELSDVYQIGEMALVEILRKIESRKVENVGAYLFKALYREIKRYITRQNVFTEIDDVYEGEKAPRDSFNVEDKISRQEIKGILGSMLDTLDERRRYVIESLYGLNNTKLKSKKEIGQVLGITYQRVQGLHNSTIRRIRKDKDLIERLGGGV